MSTHKPIVVLVHGMGNHVPGAFKKEFVRAANAAMRQYRGFKSKRIQHLVRVEEINYDQVFERVRDEMSRFAGRNSARLGAIGSLAGLGLGIELAPKLAGIEKRFGKDEFLYTHFLDVIFYTTMLGGKVRADVAKQLAELIANNPVTEIHIIAHSLGTAVLHDSLALLYRKPAGFSDAVPGLDVRLHKLASIWMIANVSRLVHTATGLADPLNSTVRPGADGCTNFLANVRHEFDPFTWFSRFDPQNDGSWIPRESFDRGYRLIETSSIRQINAHDFSDFIENPAVSVPLLRRLVRLAPSRKELARVVEEYRKGDVPGALEQLRDALRGVVVKDRATLAQVASAARHVREVMAGVIERRPALAL
jgi:hypothetical protein